jgi:hypothetical protein
VRNRRLDRRDRGRRSDRASVVGSIALTGGTAIGVLELVGGFDLGKFRNQTQGRPPARFTTDSRSISAPPAQRRCPVDVSTAASTIGSPIPAPPLAAHWHLLRGSPIDRAVCDAKVGGGSQTKSRRRITTVGSSNEFFGWCCSIRGSSPRRCRLRHRNCGSAQVGTDGRGYSAGGCGYFSG